MKVCIHCEQDKSLNEFEDRDEVYFEDGKSKICKPCLHNIYRDYGVFSTSEHRVCLYCGSKKLKSHFNFVNTKRGRQFIYSNFCQSCETTISEKISDHLYPSVHSTAKQTEFNLKNAMKSLKQQYEEINKLKVMVFELQNSMMIKGE
ncbi:hypothetical protein [Paenibacillus elgii]|uniref:hypothetical protein n=1 Tax=Paenibacillus elgii TaxID=189691 RepID=UPI00203BAE57|nr:hypothetical protein [Paenibacillus elgii]MCM3273070.1 hypothetical protein [Paenibacillus elgii]